MLKINSFEIENVKRVRAVALEPTANGLTVIGGRNGQGKTSVLDALAFALGGAKHAPSQVQNSEGMAPARIDVTLSNGLHVVREGKNCSLKVTDPSGAKAGQKLLDGLIGELALDMPAFMAMDTAKKAKLLLHCLGVEDELEALDKEERALYDERTLANRDADRKAKYASELPEYPDAPDEPVDAAGIVSALSDVARKCAQLDQASETEARLGRELLGLEREIDVLEANIRAKRERVEAIHGEIHAVQRLMSEPRPDGSELQAQLEGIEETNRRVQANNDKANALDVAREAREISDALTGQIEAVRARRMACGAAHYQRQQPCGDEEPARGRCCCHDVCRPPLRQPLHPELRADNDSRGLDGT